MKKRIVMIAAAVLLCVTLCLTACGGGESGSEGTSKGNLKVVTTIFPEYDWVNQILGEKAADAEVTMLMDNGVDLHSYQPTAQDMIKISDCDVFVYVGGESDQWVENALKEAKNKDMVVINLLDALGSGAKEEEVVEGMQEEEEHDHEESGEHGEEEEAEYDEHVWLSAKNASVLCGAITDGLSKADPDNAETYKKNLAAYQTKLSALDKDYQKAVAAASQKTLLFGDRFPFRYLTDDYGLTYYAAFVGCSAETEASFETINFLSKKIDELKLKTVLTIEGADHRIAETVIQNTKSKNQKILTLDSMQSTTAKDIENGTTYLSVMEKNLATLKEALQ